MKFLVILFFTFFLTPTIVETPIIQEDEKLELEEVGCTIVVGLGDALPSSTDLINLHSCGQLTFQINDCVFFNFFYSFLQGQIGEINSRPDFPTFIEIIATGNCIGGNFGFITIHYTYRDPIGPSEEPTDDRKPRRRGR